MVGPCLVGQYVVSSLAIISLGKLLFVNCLFMSFDS